MLASQERALKVEWKGATMLKTLVLSDKALERNHKMLLETTERKVAAFEAQFGLHSDQVKAAIDAGVLEETDEVTSWLIAILFPKYLRAADGA